MKKTSRYIFISKCWQAAIVDWDDYDMLVPYKFYLSRQGYPTETKLDKRLYHFILPKQYKIFVDHKNHNKFDNRRCNLRYVTGKQNNENRGVLNRNNTSGHRGISWDRRNKRWAAYLWHHRKKINLGQHKDLESAREARKAAELKLWTHSLGR